MSASLAEPPDRDAPPPRVAGAAGARPNVGADACAEVVGGTCTTGGTGAPGGAGAATDASTYGGLVDGTCAPAPGGTGAPGAAVEAALGQVRAGLAALRDTEWWRMADTELVEAAAEVEAALRSGFGVQVRLAQAIAARADLAVFGERSPAHLIAHTLRITVGQARARLAAAETGLGGRTLTGEPVTATAPALLDDIDHGDISDEHAAVITNCLARMPETVDPDTRDLCTDVLLDEARQRDPISLKKVAAQILEICDPDGTIDGRDPVDRAELHFGARRADGLTPVRGLLDPLTMEQLRVAVDHLSAPRPIDEKTPDRRPAFLRRAQALAEVLARYLAGTGTGPTLPGGTAWRPQIAITIPAADLLGFPAVPLTGAAPLAGEPPDTRRRPAGRDTFDYGDTVDAATVRMLACDGALIRQVLGADSAVLDQGKVQRLFTRAQRRALATRDRGCAFPGCDTPAPWCEAHHITYASHDGDTDLANGVLLCRRHHIVIHQEHWRIHTADQHAASGVAAAACNAATVGAGSPGNPRGRPWFIPPKHLDPQQTPRRNNHFHLPEILTPVRRT